jgi:hypothetical protein
MVKTYVLVLALATSILYAPLPALPQASGSGKPAPNMKGPAPRLPNGKPSLSGLWSTTRRADITDKRIPGFIAELPYTAWGKKQWDGYAAEKGDYAGSCLPFGFSRSIFGPHPTQIIQDNDYIVFLFEQNSMFHIVPTDDRGFTPGLPPSWFGESIGRWDGDMLIIETRNINGYAKLDTIGHPLSNQAKITQTYKRVNFGTIEHTFTIDDPKTYTKPWTINNTWPMEQWGTTLMEYACMEGNIEGLVSGAITPWKPPVDEQ